MRLLSFHGKQEVKDFYQARLYEHAAADELIKGQYWENGKGCAVGCTIHSREHATYETELGLPEWLARLEDVIFEGLSNSEAKQFAVDFLAAIPVGVDLAPVRWQFCAFILRENIERVLSLDFAAELKKQVVDAIRAVLACHKTAIKTGKWEDTVARSAWFAAKSAWLATRSAWLAESTWFAARSAWLATRSATESTWFAAKSATYTRYADLLLKLLRAAK